MIIQYVMHPIPYTSAQCGPRPPLSHIQYLVYYDTLNFGDPEIVHTFTHKTYGGPWRTVTEISVTADQRYK